MIQAASLAKENIEMVLLYSNKKKGDILLKEQIKELGEVNYYFKYNFTLTRHDDETDGPWHALRDRVSKNLIKRCFFPPPSSQTLICYCGPDGFNKTVKEALISIGYTNDMMHQY